MNGRASRLLPFRHDATSQYYRRNRYYDAGTGRFTQEDPIGLAGGINLYGYANGDPIKYGDPYGLSADSVKFSSPALERKIRSAARQSPTLGEALEDMERNPNVIVNFGEKDLDNPGQVDDPYVNAKGQKVIDVWFDFAEIPALMRIPAIARNGGVTEVDVIQHETYGHAQPLHEGWDCRDETGCARARENVVRPEFGRPPRRF
jgi:RHS repeat-associated protein